MTLYQIAFRESVSTGVVQQFSDCLFVDIRSIFLSEYGLTVYAHIEDDDVLEEWDWAFSMVCNMDQNLGDEE